jgi:acyl-CoA reductase-like NAD-dependent aldehyde dehydrogenase
MKQGVKGNEGGLMDEEIFGPVLPIIPVDVSSPLDT